MHEILRFSPLLLALVATACHGGDQKAFVDKFAGDPYTGLVKVRINPPGGKAWTQYGKGSARFVEKADGRAQLVVFGAIDNDKGDAGFAIDGTYDASGWKSDVKGVRLEVEPGGEITGGGTVPPQQFQFSGAATDAAFDLMVEIELLEANKNSLPKGTTFQFEYDLSRAKAEVRADNAKAGTARKSGKKCRKIRYEMRPVANIGDGSMSMMQVPICLK